MHSRLVERYQPGADGRKDGCQHQAQIFIKEGKKANEAGYLVGYNCPAQFSREY
ncbi:MAG: hypothetical protein ISR58_03785 [Anaerolineales bacterium]|nr:hypothetical protein [Chloroflexota bacterium]MBL6980292.1 hypothetical protein [Anaerolineales bacterium]